MFLLRVADNFHYMDEDDTYTYDDFATWVEAVAEARQIVDRCLTQINRPGITPAALYEAYLSFGDDPYIVPVPDGERFSAWDYARQRCTELCAAGSEPKTEPGPAAD